MSNPFVPLLKPILGVALLLAAPGLSRAQSTNSATTAKANYIDSAVVTATFAKGGTLAETPGYKVMAARREAPGQVEIHTTETDVFYVVDGTATFITGGKCPDAKVTKPGQLLGTSITGGETHHLKKGDVIIIPPGMPHQFTESSKPFLYFVVKPIGPEVAKP